MDSWRNLTRAGVRLACRDFGGVGRPVLLLDPRESCIGSGRPGQALRCEVQS